MGSTMGNTVHDSNLGIAAVIAITLRRRRLIPGRYRADAQLILLARKPGIQKAAELGLWRQMGIADDPRRRLLQLDHQVARRIGVGPNCHLFFRYPEPFTSFKP